MIATVNQRSTPNITTQPRFNTHRGQEQNSSAGLLYIILLRGHYDSSTYGNRLTGHTVFTPVSQMEDLDTDTTLVVHVNGPPDNNYVKYWRHNLR